MRGPNLAISNPTFTVDSLSISLFLQWWKILIFYTDQHVQTHKDSKNIPVPLPGIYISLIVFNKIRNSSNLLLWVIGLTGQAPRIVNAQSFLFIAFVFVHFDIIYLSIYYLHQKEKIISKIYLKYHVKKACQPPKIWWIIFVNIQIIIHCRATIKQDIPKRRLIEKNIVLQIFHHFTLDDGCQSIIICYMKDWYIWMTPFNKKILNFVC